MSGSSPYGAVTTFSPTGKKKRIMHTRWKKNTPGMLAAGHPDAAYIATACASYGVDFMKIANLGQELEVQPGGLRTRVRGLQSHRKKLETIPAGTRTAVNLGGLGFLTTVSQDELYSILEEIFSGKHRVSERVMLEAEIVREGAGSIEDFR